MNMLSPSGRVELVGDEVMNSLGRFISRYSVKIDSLTEGEFRKEEYARAFFLAACEMIGEKLDDPIDDMVSPTSYQNLHSADSN